MRHLHAGIHPWTGLTGRGVIVMIMAWLSPLFTLGALLLP